MAKTKAAAADPIVWQGSDDLRPLLVPIGGLREDPINLNTHDAASIDAIAASYAAFGQQKPVVADSAGIVRDGSGQLRAALRLGWSRLAISRTALKGAALLGYSIAANRVATLSRLDEALLAEALGSIQGEASIPALALGYTGAEIEALIAAAGDEPEDLLAPPAGPPPGSVYYPADGEEPGPGGPPGEVAGTPELVAPPSQVRMVQLFLTVATLPAFQRCIEALAAAYGTQNPTDTVMRCLEEAAGT